MKRVILAVLGLSAMIGMAMVVNRSAQPTVRREEPAIQSNPEALREESPARESVPAVKTRQPQNAVESAEPDPAPARNVSTPDVPVTDSSALKYSVDVLISAQSTFAQKQGVWKQLRESGKLDKAIADLEQRTAADPNTAANPAALGQAYLQKCGTIQDVREQGILAMQADKAFDNALNLDPSNWEARFTKAVALTYWPASMNKGEEVVGHFQTLIQQQESQAPQPQFAETYLWLGDQYQKAGQSEDARAAWQRGAGLFPEHAGLKSRLAPPQQ